MCEFHALDGGDFRELQVNGGVDDMRALWAQRKEKNKQRGGLPARVLSHQTLDRFGLQSLADPPISTRARTSCPSSWQRTHDVRQQHGVQFESPQADQRFTLSDILSLRSTQARAISGPFD